MTPRERYQNDIARGALHPDAAQARALESIQHLYDALAQVPSPIPWWGRLFGRPRHRVRGLYLWGGPGRGKTYLIDSFFEHAGDPLQEMRAAYEKREARPLARAAHKLKSAARAIGALELAGLCAAIEAAGNNGDWETTAQHYQKIDDAWARLVDHLQGQGK